MSAPDAFMTTWSAGSSQSLILAIQRQEHPKPAVRRRSLYDWFAAEPDIQSM